MFDHLLVPLDLGEGNARQLRATLALARGSRARVTLLHVIQRVPKIPPRELRAFYERLARASRRRLARVEAAFARAGIPARTLVLVGDPSREIVRLAARRRVTLIGV